MQSDTFKAALERALKEYTLPEEVYKLVIEQPDRSHREDALKQAVEVLSSLELSPMYVLKITKVLLPLAEEMGTSDEDCTAESLLELISTAMIKGEEEYIWLDYGGTKVRAINPYYKQTITTGDAQIGLRLWEAEICTLEWLESNPDFVKDKTLIELGAGLGLAGVAAVERLGAMHVTLTDTNSDVLDNLRVIAQKSPASERIDVTHLEWHDYSQYDLAADVIVAADCVYDPNDVPVFAKCIYSLLLRKPGSQALLVCSIRNRATFDLLISELKELNIVAERQPFPGGNETHSTRTVHMLNKNWSRESVVLMVVHSSE